MGFEALSVLELIPNTLSVLWQILPGLNSDLRKRQNVFTLSLVPGNEFRRNYLLSNRSQLDSETEVSALGD